MIKKITLATLTILLAMAAMAQQDYCKGLKNPTSFVIGSAGNSANAQWYGFTGSKNATASQCGAWGMTGWGSQIAASQLATQSSGSSCTSSNSTDINNQQDYMNRFVIKGSGNDPLTSNHLSYLPPDNSYTSSIRLGNNCGGTHEAEMLCYQFNVRPQNSLVFIWYALSLQNGQHSVAENPEFAIEIEKKVGNNWVRVGGDTLCYIRPTPAGSGADVSPFYVGSTGQHNTGASYGCNIYLPWNKVAINLNKYLYETVRIKVGAGDCSMSAHYACAYIAGECQSMEIQTSGCPAGSTSTVQTLTAPKGLSNYVWYKSNSGMDGISSLMDVPDNINFTRLTPEQGDTSSYHYDCTLEDFYLTEGPNANTYTNIQVFRCDMTSYMNPDIPITSKVYVSVRNTKPAMAIDTIKTCESELTLINKSYVPNDMMGCDTSITKWWFYSGATTNTAYDTAIGGTAHHTWDSAGTYAVTVRSFNRDSLNCYTDSTYFIQVLGRPQHPTIDASDHEVCVNERVMLSDATPGSIRSDWYFDDGDEVLLLPGRGLGLRREREVLGAVDIRVEPAELIGLVEKLISEPGGRDVLVGEADVRADAAEVGAGVRVSFSVGREVRVGVVDEDRADVLLDAGERHHVIEIEGFGVLGDDEGVVLVLGEEARDGIRAVEREEVDVADDHAVLRNPAETEGLDFGFTINDRLPNSVPGDVGGRELLREEPVELVEGIVREAAGAGQEENIPAVAVRGLRDDGREDGGEGGLEGPASAGHAVDLRGMFKVCR